ncbi:MAG: PleD family two-component system response regulator [Anaerolineae bacterium]|jgi:twitching motility two-component system response regulator PilH
MTEKQKSVLIIEDSPAQALALGHSLEQAGLRVLWARDGQIGVSMAKEHLPDVILLDVEMPKMDGFEACQQLKENVSTSNIPIVMLTVHTELSTMNTLLDQGAVEFIPKGAFSEAVLLETLRQLQIITSA